MNDSKRDICERSFAFAVRIVRLCQTLDEIRGVNRTLANQLLRSGTSIGANIEEAQAILKFTPNKAANVTAKVLKSAVANAQRPLNLVQSKQFFIYAVSYSYFSFFTFPFLSYS